MFSHNELSLIDQFNPSNESERSQSQNQNKSITSGIQVEWKKR